ncbi:MAG: Amidase, partial [Acidimicrobiia bacterium]|nr:Amidase [Acidimicrobiia bacterium]
MNQRVDGSEGDTWPVDTVGAFVGLPAVLAKGPAGAALSGVTLAVKDVFDVAGTVTGAGNPTFAQGREPAAAHAGAVQQLVAAGATVIGKTVTDELAYSLQGTNVHFGTPRNVAAPGRIPGGSSAGSAAAVAAGLCDLGLGTDTGGSVRVPASYCGIVGWRPTHGAVCSTGVVHLSRSFDTVGLMARSLTLLRAAADVLLTDAASVPEAVGSVAVVSELLDLVDPEVGDAITAAAAPWAPAALVLGIDLVAAAQAFRVLQGREAWIEHGAWISSVHPAMGPGINERFAAAARITDEQVADAQMVRAEVRQAVNAATAAGQVLVGPAAAGPAPPIDEPMDRRATTRARTLQLTCLAGLA